MAEEYLEKKRFSYDHTKAFRVLVRDLARYEAFRNKILGDGYAWNIDKITRKDIEDFENYLRRGGYMYTHRYFLKRNTRTMYSIKCTTPGSGWGRDKDEDDEH